MSKRKPVKPIVRLTDRTLQDLIAIEEYSITTWGKKVAAKYMSDIESGLRRIADNPGLLREEPNLHKCPYFYRVNKHLLVCDVQAKTFMC